jgi:hypothetical protein
VIIRKLLPPSLDLLILQGEVEEIVFTRSNVEEAFTAGFTAKHFMIVVIVQ